jgi:hypothetical protein
VLEEAVAVGHKPLEKALQIPSHFGIRVLLDEQ